MPKIIAVQSDQINKMKDSYAKNAKLVATNNASVISSALENPAPIAEPVLTPASAGDNTPVTNNNSDMEATPVNLSNPEVVASAADLVGANVPVEMPNTPQESIVNVDSPVEISTNNMNSEVAVNSPVETSEPSAAELINPGQDEELNPFAVTNNAPNMFDIPSDNTSVQDVVEVKTNPQTSSPTNVVENTVSEEGKHQDDYIASINAIRNKIDAFSQEIHAELDRLQSLINSKNNNVEDNLDKTVVIPGDVMQEAIGGRSL